MNGDSFGVFVALPGYWGGGGALREVNRQWQTLKLAMIGEVQDT